MFPSCTQMDTELDGEKFECTEYGLVGTYLMVNLETVLEGRTRGHGSVFYIWVQEKLWRRSQNRCVWISCTFENLLRSILATSPRESLEFDTIMLASETKTIASSGEWVAGAAFCQQSKCDRNSQQLDSAQEIYAVYKYVGRLLIERIHHKELSNNTRTTTFEGSLRVNIDAEGIWRVKRVCIT